MAGSDQSCSTRSHQPSGPPQSAKAQIPRPTTERALREFEWPRVETWPSLQRTVPTPRPALGPDLAPPHPLHGCVRDLRALAARSPMRPGPITYSQRVIYHLKAHELDMHHKRSPTSAIVAGMEGVEASAWAQLQEAMSYERKATLGSSVARFGHATALIATKTRVLAVNRVIGLGTIEDLSKTEIDNIIEHYSKAGASRFLVQWSPAARPPGASQWLVDRGFHTIEATSKLLYDFQAVTRQYDVSTSLSVQEIDDSSRGMYEDIVAPALGVPTDLAAGITSTIGHPGWRYYMAHDGSRPVAGAAMLIEGAWAWLGVCATLPSDRRRGAQTALLQRRLHAARTAGCKWATSDTSPPTVAKPNTSFSNMEKVGFKHIYDRANYMYQVSD
jgi:hypothetical protein